MKDQRSGPSAGKKDTVQLSIEQFCLLADLWPRFHGGPDLKCNRNRHVIPSAADL